MHPLSKFALSLAGLVAACATPSETGNAKSSPLTSVAALDVPRYAGTWYEIAKYPNWFQRNCIGDTQATYRPLPDGKVEVVNRCRTKSGSMDAAIGMARPAASGVPSQLQVTFVPGWLDFLPFLWADYWVIDIDPGYQLVAVSEPRRKYLWILSRTPRVDDRALAALRERLQGKGFDLAALTPTPQSDSTSQ